MRRTTTSQLSFSGLLSASAPQRIFSSTSPVGLDSAPGIGDLGDVMKVNCTEEFDQGLTDEQKASMKRFDIYRSNPNDPEDTPKYVTYYID